MGTQITTATRLCVLTLSALVLFVGACGDSTSPDDEPGGPVPTIEASAEQIRQTQLAVDDVSLRLIPSIANFPGTFELAAAISALSRAVQESNARDVETNVARSETALAQVRQESTDAQSADLDAIALAIFDAERLLTYPTPS